MSENIKARAMDKLSDGVELVRAYAASRAPYEIVGSIYAPISGSAPSGGMIESILADTSLRLPVDQASCLGVLDDARLPDIEQLLWLHAALRRVPKSTTWLHVRIGSILDRMSSVGVPGAAIACLLHCLLALEGSDARPTSLSGVHEILGRLLLSFAPREGLRHALTALRLGNQRARATAIEAATRLGLAPAGSPAAFDRTRLAELALKVNVRFGGGFRSVPVSLASRLTQAQAFPASTGAFDIPANGRDHPIFAASSGRFERSAVDVIQIEDGAVSVSIENRGAPQLYIFDSDRACIEELSAGYEPFIDTPMVELSGSVAILDDKFPGFNVCHFLLDKLSRIAVYRAAGFNPDWFLLFTDNQYYRDAFAHLGLLDRLVTFDRTRNSLKARAILTTTNIARDLSHPAHFCAPWSIDFLRESFPVVASNAPARRVFISRGDAGSRRIVNWPDVQRILKRFDFETVELSTLRLQDQIELFAAAHCIAGVHGAGLTNMLFANKGTRVVEILPPMMATHAFWMLACALGHPYRAIIGHDPEYTTASDRGRALNYRMNARDIVIDTVALREALAWAIRDA